MKKYFEALEFFADKLNRNGITWGLGGSFLLYMKNVTDIVHDIDIIIDVDDYDKLLVVLKNIPFIYMEPNDLYLTKHFFSIKINEIDFDLMLDFKINCRKKVYSFLFEKSKLEKIVTDNGIDIYLTSLDEWRIAYKAMNRVDKTRLLDDFYLKI